MEIYGETHTGKVRETNQDTCAFEILPGECCFAIVCDGMGGTKGGDTASNMASQIVKNEIIKNYNKSMDENRFSGLLIHAITLANKEIFKAAHSEENLAGMGTTIVAAAIKDEVLHVAHVGDSRAYLIKNKSMDKITNDHSIVQEMLEKGSITEDEASKHPQKNLITRALGIDCDVVVDYKAHKISINDLCLLCSDGLTNLVSDNDILKIIQNKDLQTAVKDLIDKANNNGGNDNITAVLIRAN